jgi:hypothetical protein
MPVQERNTGAPMPEDDGFNNASRKSRTKIGGSQGEFNENEKRSVDRP